MCIRDRLTRAQKKEIDAVLRKYKGDGKPRTAQATILYEACLLYTSIYAANSHKVLPVESCLLQDEVLDKTMLAVRAAAGTCHYQPFNEDKGTGLLRHCLLRRGVMTGQVMVVLVTAQPVLPGAKNFVKALLTREELDLRLPRERTGQAP